MLLVWISAKLHTSPCHTSHVQSIPETPTIMYKIEPKPFSLAFGVGHSATFRHSSMALLLYIRQSMPTPHRWPSHELFIHSCCFFLNSFFCLRYLPVLSTPDQHHCPLVNQFRNPYFHNSISKPFFSHIFPSPVAFNLPSSVFSCFIPVTEFVVPGLTLWL